MICPDGQTSGAKVVGREGNNPDCRLKFLIAVKLKVYPYISVEVGLEAAIL